jgi:curved DNA-binding protein CbpA
MTDYFALLEQPRAPWLDPAVLQETYHRKTLQDHPDTAGPDVENNFTDLTRAYEVLHDPKQRLQHLLSLEGSAPPATNQVIPEELQDLFLAIGKLHQSANLVLEKTRAASNALSRSLLRPQVVETQTAVTALREEVGNLEAAATQRLREVSSNWEKNPGGQIAALTDLYSRFAYLGRWAAQLDELTFQLTM